MRLQLGMLTRSAGTAEMGAPICPPFHEDVLIKLLHRDMLPGLNVLALFAIIQGRALIRAGSSLPTSHPAGLCPHHCPAFGTGELQEGGTTL